jgi:hypothetical protein
MGPHCQDCSYPAGAVPTSPAGWRIVLTSRPGSGPRTHHRRQRHPSARGVLQPLRYPGDVEPLIAAWFSERQTMCISQPTRTVHESAAPSRQGYRAARQHPSRYVIGTGLAPRRAAPPFCSVIVRSRRQRYPAQIWTICAGARWRCDDLSAGGPDTWSGRGEHRLSLQSPAGTRRVPAAQSGYSSLRHMPASLGLSFGVRSSRNE